LNQKYPLVLCGQWPTHLMEFADIEEKEERELDI
jgi:hypothetical protein